MGGIFSTPSPPPPSPPPAPEPSDEDGREARLKALERRRRGRAGTIATSPRGLLDPRTPDRRRKNLLGE